MKRYIIPGILAALLTVSLLPAPTYTYVVRELSQSFTAIQTFSAGMAIASGQKLYLEGASGDSYLMWDADSQQVQVFNNGTIRARITESGVIPGDCPSDPYAIEGGTQCFEPSTGKLWISDFTGVHEVGR